MSILELILVLALMTAICIAIVAVCFVVGGIMLLSPRTREHALPVILIPPAAAIGSLIGAIVTYIGAQVPFREFINSLVSSGLGKGATLGALAGAILGIFTWLVVSSARRRKPEPRTETRGDARTV